MSPRLAKVYLHDVVDRWVDAWRHTAAQGEMVVVRCADDVVHGFELRRDAERFLAALRGRLQPFGLALHAEKTRLIACGPHAMANRKQRAEGNLETFDLLGCTPSCERHRKTGSFTVRRQTAQKRLGAKLKAIHQQLRRRRHAPTAPTAQWLQSVVQGDCNDHAVPATCGPSVPSGGGLSDSGGASCACAVRKPA